MLICPALDGIKSYTSIIAQLINSLIHLLCKVLRENIFKIIQFLWSLDIRHHLQNLHLSRVKNSLFHPFSIKRSTLPQNYAFSSKLPRNSQEICNSSANYHKINSKLLTVNYKLLFPRRSHPAKPGEDRFGPPTLERSCSEHRRAVTSLIPMVGI